MPTLRELQKNVLTQPNSPLGEGAIDSTYGTSRTYLPDVSVTYFRIIYIFIWILGIIAFIALIYGGVLYVTAGAEAEKAERGKKVLIGAIIGIIIVMVSYAAYNTFIKAMTKTYRNNDISEESQGEMQKVFGEDPSTNLQ